jgi:hypothetical protein
MIYPILDTSFLMNFILSTGTFHVFARDIDNNIMDQRALFERYVIVDSVEHEFFKVLLNSNTVI